MQLPNTRQMTSIAEYLKYENEATAKHEYRDGEVLAMAGGTGEHSRIISNAIREFGNALKGKPCEVFESNLRIGIPGTPLFAYPDASVICGPMLNDPRDSTGQTKTNPRVLIEVLSPSTEGYDRGEKFSRYRTIETLEEYVLISQEVARVEIFRRQGDGTWLFTSVAGLKGRVKLASVQVEVPMAEIYARVEFAAGGPSS